VKKRKKMKTKNSSFGKAFLSKKRFALVEIAVVLCSVFLVAIPAIAADQTTQKISATGVTTASEDNYVLGVYGNANEDDTIDMGDVVYTKLAIFGKKPKTELCDAKYDGRINVLDVIQAKLIILGKEKELTVVDTADRIVTVKKPLRKIVVCFPHAFEALRSLKVPKDIIAGVAKDRWDTAFFPEIGDIPSVGWRWTPDIEEILNLHPDAVIIGAYTFGASEFKMKPIAEALESAGITVLAFNCNIPDTHQEEMKNIGYIFGKQDEAKEYLDWYGGIISTTKEKVDTISEEDKPKVYFEAGRPYRIYGERAHIAFAGGKDIFADQPGSSMSIDPETVIARNPDILVALTSRGGGYDMVDTTELKALRNEIMNRPELQEVKAVKEGKVYIIAVQIYTAFPASGCRYFAQIAYMAKWFHPDLFEDLDPKAIHQEYLTRFQGLDIDLDKKGVFVYPEPS
jgi:iron complex transport system substrate-binding protein